MGFIDSFFGSSSGNDDLRYGNEQANKFLDTGLAQYTNTSKNYLEDALNYINPAIEQGNDYNQLYDNYLGRNGVEAQQQAYDGFIDSPGYQYELDSRVDALDQSATSRGQLFSGRQMKTVADEGQSFQRSALENYLNRLSGQAQQGNQAAYQGANYTYNTGQNIGNAQFGVNQQKAAGIRGVQNQVAQSRGSGLQSALNFAGTAAKAYAGMPQAGGYY